MQGKTWLLVFPTVLFFGILGYAILSGNNSTMLLDDSRAILSLLLGIGVGAVVCVIALRGGRR